MGHGYQLDADEQTIRHIPHHWIEVAAFVSMSLIMFGIAIIFTFILARQRELIPAFIPDWVIIVLILAFTVIGILIYVLGFWVYNRNYMLITSHHLIQKEQHGLFSSQVDQVSLGRIQDVSGKQPGFLATILGYGTVTVQSAGEQRQFLFHHVPDPQGLADYILHLHEEYIRQNPGGAD